MTHRPNAIKHTQEYRPLRQTCAPLTQNPGDATGTMFKRRRHCIVHNNTVIDRPRGFAIVARTKVPRRGTKGCGR